MMLKRATNGAVALLFLAAAFGPSCAHPVSNVPSPAVRFGGSISGRIVDENSQPRAGVPVRVVPWPGPDSSADTVDSHRLLETTSSSSGGFAIEGIPDGSWMIFAGDPRIETGGVGERHVIDGGNTIQGVSVVLHPMQAGPPDSEGRPTYRRALPIEAMPPEVAVIGRAMQRALASLDEETAKRLTPDQTQSLIEREIPPEEFTPAVRVLLDSMRKNGGFQLAP